MPLGTIYKSLGGVKSRDFEPSRKKHLRIPTRPAPSVQDMTTRPNMRQELGINVGHVDIDGAIIEFARIAVIVLDIDVFLVNHVGTRSWRTSLSDDDIKKSEVRRFLFDEEGSISSLRTVLLFGRNTATYKFALLHAISAVAEQKITSELRYHDLRDEFLKALVRHYRECPNQFNSGATKLTAAIDKHISGEIDWNALMTQAEKNIYNNVFDAFQNVGGGTLARDSMLFEHDREQRRLVLTDHFLADLGDTAKRGRIIKENEARWRAVEEAWRIGVSTNLIYNEATKSFDATARGLRISVRSALDALLPYQKGRCFYCQRDVAQEDVSFTDPAFPDVDHFIPVSLFKAQLDTSVNPNGVWNLVVACAACNRGVGGGQGKKDQVPDTDFFERLLTRNVYFSEEHTHGLKLSVLNSLSVSTKEQLRDRIKTIYKWFANMSKWRPREIRR